MYNPYCSFKLTRVRTGRSDAEESADSTIPAWAEKANGALAEQLKQHVVSVSTCGTKEMMQPLSDPPARHLSGCVAMPSTCGTKEMMQQPSLPSLLPLPSPCCPPVSLCLSLYLPPLSSPSSSSTLSRLLLSICAPSSSPLSLLPPSAPLLSAVGTAQAARRERTKVFSLHFAAFLRC